jgi:type I restriction enzyme S subunit
MEMQKNMPQLRFPDFEGEWEKKKLGELSIINPTTVKLPNKFIYIDLESVTNGQLIKEEVVFKNEAPSRAQRVLEIEDILFQMVRPYQKNNLYFDKNGDYVASTGYAQIKTKQSSRFLYQYLHLQQFVDEVIERCTGTSYPAINSKDLAKISVSYPTLPEQQKIASFFTAIDKKITQLKQKKTLLEHYKKGAMQKIFSQQVRFKDDKGFEFPKWEKSKFNQIYSFRVTNSFSRDDLNYEEGDVKNLHYGDIHTKFNTLFDITKEEVPFIKPDVSIKRISSDNYCKTSDIVFADASEDLADVGKSIELVNLNDEKVLAGLHTILARPDVTKIASGFGGYLMKSPEVRQQIMKIAQGSKITSISSTRLCDIELNTPCPDEQTKIANFLSSIDVKINQTRMQIEKAEVWKKGLMQQMFV